MSRKFKVQMFFFNAKAVIIMAWLQATSWVSSLKRNNTITESKTDVIESAFKKFNIDLTDPEKREGVKDLLFQVLGYNNLIPAQLGIKLGRLDRKVTNLSEKIVDRQAIIQALRKLIDRDSITLDKAFAQISKTATKMSLWE